jgi:CHAD domain-containing protein
MSPNADAESSRRTIAECEEAIGLLLAEKEELEARIRELRAAEDFRAGKTFAGEIFTMQQEKLRLETEVHILRNRIKRIRYQGG